MDDVNSWPENAATPCRSAGRQCRQTRDQQAMRGAAQTGSLAAGGGEEEEEGTGKAPMHTQRMRRPQLQGKSLQQPLQAPHCQWQPLGDKSQQLKAHAHAAKDQREAEEWLSACSRNRHMQRAYKISCECVLGRVVGVSLRQARLQRLPALSRRHHHHDRRNHRRRHRLRCRRRARSTFPTRSQPTSRQRRATPAGPQANPLASAWRGTALALAQPQRLQQRQRGQQAPARATEAPSLGRATRRVTWNPLWMSEARRSCRDERAPAPVARAAAARPALVATQPAQWGRGSLEARGAAGTTSTIGCTQT